MAMRAATVATHMMEPHIKGGHIEPVLPLQNPHYPPSGHHISPPFFLPLHTPKGVLCSLGALRLRGEGIATRLPLSPRQQRHCHHVIMKGTVPIENGEGGSEEEEGSRRRREGGDRNKVGERGKEEQHSLLQ